MIPGLTEAAEARLAALLTPAVTDLTRDDLAALPFQMFAPGDAVLADLGVQAQGSDLMIVVTDPTRPVGHLVIDAASPGFLLFLDNRAAEGALSGHIRMLGRDSAVLFPSLGPGTVALPIVLLRSDAQLVFWGQDATAVGCSVELEGPGRTLAIGDDALISAGVWIRNHDMHAIVDLRSDAVINRPPVDMIVERHVWIGQNAMLLSCARIGAGSIVGAQSLVKADIAPMTAAGGVPARVIRTGVSWGRAVSGLTQAERDSLARLGAVDEVMTAK